MRYHRLLLAVLCLAAASTGIAQSKPAAATPDQVVKDLYAAQKSEKDAPFFQYKNRSLIDRYFTGDLGGLIWKDAVAARGEVGALDFDPLYYSQDPQVTDFVVGKPREGGSPDSAFVPVTFKNGGKAEKIEFELLRGADKTWKIHSIIYSDGEDLGSTLNYALNPEVRAEYDANPFKGDFLVGTRKCTVTPTKTGLAHKVQCDGRGEVLLYFVEGTETETEYIHTDDKGTRKSKFVFKNGESSGKFIDESAKEVKVSRVR